MLNQTSLDEDSTPLTLSASKGPERSTPLTLSLSKGWFDKLTMSGYEGSG